MHYFNQRYLKILHLELAKSYNCTSEQHISTLCLQANGVMLNFWNEAIDNQLTLLHRVLKCRTVKLACVLFCFVWILGSAQQTRWKEWAPAFKRKKKWQRKTLSFQMTEFKWTHSAKENVFSLNCLRQKGRNKHALHASFLYSSCILVWKWSIFRDILHVSCYLKRKKGSIWRRYILVAFA